MPPRNPESSPYSNPAVAEAELSQLRNLHRLSTDGETITPDQVLAEGKTAEEIYGINGNVLAEFELGGDDEEILGLTVQLEVTKDGDYVLHTFEEVHFDESGDEIPDEAQAVTSDLRHNSMSLPSDGTSFKLGRNEQSKQLIPDAESRMALSYNHMEFSVGGDGVNVKDLDSKNGTLVVAGEHSEEAPVEAENEVLDDNPEQGEELNTGNFAEHLLEASDDPEQLESLIAAAYASGDRELEFDVRYLVDAAGRFAKAGEFGLVGMRTTEIHNELGEALDNDIEVQKKINRMVSHFDETQQRVFRNMDGFTSTQAVLRELESGQGTPFGGYQEALNGVLAYFNELDGNEAFRKEQERKAAELAEKAKAVEKMRKQATEKSEDDVLENTQDYLKNLIETREGDIDRAQMALDRVLKEEKLPYDQMIKEAYATEHAAEVFEQVIEPEYAHKIRNILMQHKHDIDLAVDNLHRIGGSEPVPQETLRMLREPDPALMSILSDLRKLDSRNMVV